MLAPSLGDRSRDEKKGHVAPLATNETVQRQRPESTPTKPCSTFGGSMGTRHAVRPLLLMCFFVLYMLLRPNIAGFLARCTRRRRSELHTSREAGMSRTLFLEENLRAFSPRGLFFSYFFLLKVPLTSLLSPGTTFYVKIKVFRRK